MDYLHSLAQKAKNRLKTNTYSKDEAVENKLDKFSISLNKNNISKEEVDKEFADKCLALIKSKENVLNPLARLIDEEKFNKLSDISKERYIIDLSKKYVNLLKIIKSAS